MLNSKTEFDILDTLKFKNKEIFLKQQHIERTTEAFLSLSVRTSFKKVKSVYDQFEQMQLDSTKILRVLFSKNDPENFQLETHQPVFIKNPVQLQLIAEIKQVAGQGPQNYKWVHRPFWDSILNFKKEGIDDLIAVNEKNEITESSRFNLFFYDLKTDLVLTPPLSSGCINGVYRRFVMVTKKIDLPDHGPKNIQEASIDPKKIATYQIYVANAVREVLKAELR